MPPNNATTNAYFFIFIELKRQPARKGAKKNYPSCYGAPRS